MNTPLTNTQMRDVEALLHPYTNAIDLRRTGPHIIERGEGVRVFDDAGKPYIEGMAGLWCCGLGFSDRELIEAAKEQLDKLPYMHLFGGRSHEPAVELAEKIKELLPTPMARVIYQSSGSEANDSQIKLYWYYNNARGKPEKKKIISRVKGYHGVTIVSASLTGLPYNHQDFDLPVDRILHTSSPHHWKEAHEGESEAEFIARCVTDLETLIEREGADTIAAMIAEPVLGAGGVIVPPEGYYPAMQAVLDANDIALISDEVICGFGRTGTWFGAESMEMRPRSFSLAKQLTAGYVPLSAVAMDQEMAETIEGHTGQLGTLGHGFTYGGHPLGCAVGSAAIDIYKSRNILGHVQSIMPVFSAHMSRLSEHPLVGEARLKGLMGGLELAPPGTKGFAKPGAAAKFLSGELLKHGVILRPIMDTLAICPPMVITSDELDEMFAPVEAALDTTMAWAKSEGHMG